MTDYLIINSFMKSEWHCMYNKNWKRPIGKGIHVYHLDT